MAAYLSFLYCRLGRLDSAALCVLFAWLAMVFCVFGRAASRFLCPNLSSISAFLKMPQSMAGVTLAALGNGAPDLFSTFAAAQANAFPMALGELLGAANFITMVVVGTIALVSPFQVPRWPFLRVRSFSMSIYVLYTHKNDYYKRTMLLSS
jgi:Ca2+/Na+ antiporter